MNILLVTPRSSLPISVRSQPSMALAYLGAISMRDGHRVRLIDQDVDNTPLDKVVAEFKPDVMAVTANTSQIKSAWRATEAVKTAAAREGRPCWVVAGGIHPTVLSDESLGKGTIDFIVQGEGEATWEHLTRVIEEANRSGLHHLSGDTSNNGARLGKSPFYEVDGIAWRDADGSIHHNKHRPAIADLDALPYPAYTLFDLDKYTNLQPTVDAQIGRTLNMYTSRGCPYRCTYCSQSVFPEKWHCRSPENVVTEWERLIKEFGATEIGILDDIFNIDRKRVIKICELLIAKKLNHVPWIMINGIRANLADREVLGMMKKAGCKRTAFGVETGNQIILDSIDKRLKLDQVRAAFKAARQVGLETIGFFMIGLPGDTEETIDETIEFACELDPVVANFSMTTPFPGTILYDQVKAHGKLLIDDYDDFLFFEGKARYEMGDLTPELMERKWREAYRRFYLRPHRIAQTLGRKSTWQHLPRVASMAARIVLPKPVSSALTRRDREATAVPTK